MEKYIISHQKIKKSPGQKKPVKSNKSISRKICWPKSIFLQFQIWPKINFWTEKTAKNAILRKKIDTYLISRVFFACTFLNFLARCVELHASGLLKIFLYMLRNWKSYLNIVASAPYDESNLFNRNLHLDCHRSGWDMLVSTTKF